MKYDHLSPDLDILEAEIESGPPRSTLEIRREVMAWFVAAARERDDLRAEVARLKAELDAAERRARHPGGF